METKQRTRQRTTIRNVRGSELPADWAQQAGVAPDQEVDIVIQDRRAAWQRLQTIMTELGKEAEKSGFTEEKLDALLQDIEHERQHEPSK